MGQRSMLGDPGAVACQVLALLPDVGVLSVDHDLVIRAVDGSVFARYGWRADLLVGRPLPDALPARQVEQLRPHYEMALRGTRTATSLAGVDGRGDFDIAFEPWRDSRGDVIGALAIAREFSAGGGETFGDGEEVFRLLVDGVRDYAILMLDPDGMITTWNTGAARLKGYGAGEIVGRHFSVFYPAEDVAAGKPESELEVAAREGQLWDEGWRVRKDGTRFWANVLITAVRGPDGGLRGYSKVTRDMSKQRTADLALRDSEEVFRLLVDGVRDYAILMLDPDGMITTWNTGAARLKGYGAGEIVGRHFSVFYPAEDVAAGKPESELEVAAREGQLWDEGWRVRKDGTRFWANVLITAVRGPDGGLRGYSKVTRDMSKQRTAEHSLRVAEERFRSAFENAAVGMAIVSATNGTIGRYLDVNDALCEMTGYGRPQLLAKDFASITHPDDQQRSSEAIEDLLSGRIESYVNDERYIHAAGHTVDVAIAVNLVRDTDGKPLQFVAQVQDIGSRKRYEQQLAHMANHDPLTSLPNRARFDELLDRHMARVRRNGPVGALLLIDLDHFKQINDTLGHNAGDEALIAVARVLQARVRETDLVARLGGDEFVVLMTDGDEDAAQVLAADISDLIHRRTVGLAGEGINLTASIGIAVFDDHEAGTGDDFLAEADIAMYNAKADGRNRISAHATKDGKRRERKARMTVHNQIEWALRNDSFELCAQPVMRLSDNALSKYELLLRMRQQDGSLISPATFLSVAERFDQVESIDRWVITHAMDLLAAAQARGSDIALEINLSGRSIDEDWLPSYIAAELSRTNVDTAAGQLIFEITETTAVRNIHRAREFANELGELGCKFALDDFGAGFGSFYYLKYLPFDYLKIDGEFIRQCTNSRTDQLVIQSCVQLAKGLGKATIGEMVEDADTLRLLRALGVDYAQGYHIARPAPVTLDNLTALGIPDATDEPTLA